MFHSRRIWIAAPLLMTLMLSAAYWYHERQRFADFTVHDRGMVFSAASLDPATISEIIETYQIRTVINLCEPDEISDKRCQDERRAVEEAGATFLLEPLSASAAADDPSVSRQIAILKDPDNYPILVHSRQSVEQTAKFLVTYDVLFRGMSASAALETQSHLGGDHNEHRTGLTAFAQELERRHTELYPTASADNLKILR